MQGVRRADDALRPAFRSRGFPETMLDGPGDSRLIYRPKHGGLDFASAK